ncbi:MAG: translational GTPase TypA [Vampirovibrionales bacterium]|nr:translational GTPase TypA [Vampirovibrionales bacterium]
MPSETFAKPSSPAENGILNDKIRNIAIIAHVDHGKTTLVDSMFRQSGIYRENEQIAERAMDSHELERERGITILAKNTAIPYGEYKINILDTPGHADFSGEVERVLTMVDGALLIVDAVEGPMPQTRFVLRKALALGLKIVVVINKVDRPASDPARAIDRMIDLLIELGADEHQLEFPTVYACGLQGTSTLDAEEASRPETMGDLTALFQTILKEIPAPPGDKTGSLQLQVATIDYNDYLGRIIVGRIRRGEIKQGQTAALVDREGKITQHRITKLFGFQGLKKIDVDKAFAGDIVAVAGIPEIQIGETICDPLNPEALPPIDIEEPTLKMTFSVNNSPLAGKEGKFVTSRQIKDRLAREVKSNVSLRVDDGPTPECFVVSGRGELHLGILIETMRREGYEFQVSKPEVLTKEVNGELHEPSEQLMLDVPEDNTGACIERLSVRKGELQNMYTENGRTMLEFKIPSRGLLGFRSEFIRLTRGQGIMNAAFSAFVPWVGDIGTSRNGVIVSNEQGEATAYAMKNLEDRGVFFITPKTTVYRGMIVGEHNRSNDLLVNVVKAKKLTNMRSAGADVLEVLSTPITVTLEYGLDYIATDELMEVTPQNIRLRKQSI